MNPHYEVLNVEQGSEVWKQERLKYVTASQIQAIIGLCPYQTAVGLLREKITGEEVEVSSYKRVLFEKGHRAERAAREWVEAEYNLKFPQMVVVSKRCADLLASLDGFNVENNIILEAKYMGAKAVNELKAGKFKSHHICQIQGQLYATAADKCIYFGTNGEGDSAFVEIKPDPEYATKIDSAVVGFMNDIREYKEFKEKLLSKYMPKRAKGDIFPVRKR